MSHLFDSGFSVRKPAWHQLTNVLAESPKTFNAARKAAGISWEVEEGPVFGFERVGVGDVKVFDPRALILDDETQRKLASQVRGQILQGQYLDALEAMGAVLIEDKKRTLRSDTAATLGVPGAEYEVISNDEIGEICTALVKALGGRKAKVTWEALVSLEGGKSIVATLYLDEPVTLPGDNSEVLPMLVVSARHDGAGAARAQTTTIRVICANTRAMSDNEADRNRTVFTFRHGASWRDRLDEAVQTLMGARAEFAENVEFMSSLAKIKVSDQQTKQWLERFLPYPVSAADTSSDRALVNIDERRLTVKEILRSDTCNAFAGKALSLLFAGDEFLDNYRGLTADGSFRSPETVVRRNLLVPEKMKYRQVQIIRDVLGIAA